MAQPIYGAENIAKLFSPNVCDSGAGVLSMPSAVWSAAGTQRG